MKQASAALLLAALPLAAAAQQNPQEQLESVRHNLDAARGQSQALQAQGRNLQAEVAKLQAQEVALARQVQATEAALSVAEQDFTALQQKETDQAADLGRRQAHETEILSALEQLATMPPELVTVAPGTPVDVARSGILLGAAAPALQDQVRQLAIAMKQLQATERQLAIKHDALDKQRATLDDQSKKLAALLEQRKALETDTQKKEDASQQHVAQLVAQASSLKQLVDKLEADQAMRAKSEAEAAAQENAERAKATQEAAMHPPPAPVSPGPGPAGGHLLAPVTGEVTKRYGQADGAAPARGVTYQTRPSAQIVAPAGGSILFAGPFKGYGQILIIDHGGGYSSLLAGLGKIECAVGQKVAGGEPVGMMPTDGTPALYLEIRRQNQPVDPAAWLGLKDQKVSG